MQITKFHHEFQVVYNNKLDLYCVRKGKKYLIFFCETGLKYIMLPESVMLKKKKNLLFFKNLTDTSPSNLQFANFQKNLSYLLKTLNKRFKKYLIVKGLGMRINYVQSLNVLKLKLGFSHLITITVPSGIKVFKNKNLLILESSEAFLVGNFANLIRNLRYPDSYKGKGLWYKNEIQILKPVKKV